MSLGSSQNPTYSKERDNLLQTFSLSSNLPCVQTHVWCRGIRVEPVCNHSTCVCLKLWIVPGGWTVANFCIACAQSSNFWNLPEVHLVSQIRSSCFKPVPATQQNVRTPGRAFGYLHTCCFRLGHGVEHGVDLHVHVDLCHWQIEKLGQRTRTGCRPQRCRWGMTVFWLVFSMECWTRGIHVQSIHILIVPT